MDKEFELKPHNNQKSYYGKARVVQEEEISTFFIDININFIIFT